MSVLLAIFSGVAICFGFVLLVGAPYIPTHTRQTDLALDLLRLKRGQCLYELGCGDGKLLRAAAKRGIHSVGYELNPILFFIAWLSTRKYRQFVSVRFGNFWSADLSKADGVYVFLLDRFMERLHRKLTDELKSGVRLVSYVFKIPGEKPSKEQEGLTVYTY